jgi:hypothetical protein
MSFTSFRPLPNTLDFAETREATPAAANGLLTLEDGLTFAPVSAGTGYGRKRAAERQSR